jgi:hypothetical protein
MQLHKLRQKPYDYPFNTHVITATALQALQIVFFQEISARVRLAKGFCLFKT